MFDSWAGHLSPKDYDVFAAPYQVCATYVRSFVRSFFFPASLESCLALSCPALSLVIPESQARGVVCLANNLRTAQNAAILVVLPAEGYHRCSQ